MKNLIILIALLFISNVTKAQYNPQYRVLNANGMGSAGAGTCTGDIYIVMYAISSTNCSTVLGYTVPIALSSYAVSGTNSGIYDYSTLSGGSMWAVDPGACSSTNEWGFDKVMIYTCNGTPSSVTGTSACNPGNPQWLDGIILDNCGGLVTDCFDYSISCTSCSTGQNMNVNFSPAGSGGQSTVDITRN
jgi:hypothetical protein